MKQYRVAFLGFGNVGKALQRLCVLKANELREHYGIECCMTGIATRSGGWLSNTNGIPLFGSPASGFQVSQLNNPANSPIASGAGGFSRVTSINEWLQAAQPDVVFETTPLNHETGQPAIDYLRLALESGSHVITANKGALVHGYQDLAELAKEKGRQFLFESTVLDSAPVFSLFRETLPAVNLRAFSGIFSSTANVIIETMEAGRSFAEGLKTAQELGITETDPSHDIDGWDATVKVCILANVLMNIRLKPDQVNRDGIRQLSQQRVQAARSEGKPFKLVARTKKVDDETLVATVRPEQIAAGDPLSTVRGTSLAIHFELDMMPGLTITSHRPNLQSTAYGLFADFVNAVKG